MDFDLTQLDGGVTVLTLDGKLNMTAASRLRDAVSSAVGAGHKRIVADLSRVDFIDSSGLGALISGLKTARQAGGDLRIASAAEQVKLVLQLTNMDRVLVPYASAAEAFGNG